MPRFGSYYIFFIICGATLTARAVLDSSFRNSTLLYLFIPFLLRHSRGPQDWILDGAALQAYNVPIMAIPTMGESWHNNHHAFPSSARHGLYPGQIDLGWYFILVLEKLGLAWNIKVPAKLPARPGITPTTKRALSIAAPGQDRM